MQFSPFGQSDKCGSSLLGGPWHTPKAKRRIPEISPEGRLAFFVTSNIHKFFEARSMLAEYGIATAMLKIETVEIQNDDLEIIAKATAADAVEKCRLPIIVEDAGLFITALKGFPGPYSSYVYRTIGTKGILKLMQGVNSRVAQFRSVIAFKGPKEPMKCFHGNISGEISMKERGNSGFGFDPIFKPLNTHLTFAEMPTEEKNKCSHRAQALRKFAEWYLSKPQRSF
jgi:XTP/dITP diphosphohydrolase